jgi:nucleosome assembly protein 1-like 1
LYERRQAIITGKAEPTDGDVEAGKAADSDDEDDEEEEEKSTEEGADVKGIPEFWLTALKNAMPIAEQITDNDEEVSLTMSHNSAV